MNLPLASVAIHRGVSCPQPAAPNLAFGIERGLPGYGFMCGYGVNETRQEPHDFNWMRLK